MAFTFLQTMMYTSTLAVLWLHLVDYIFLVMQPKFQCDFSAIYFATLSPSQTENQYQRMGGHQPSPKCSSPERKRKVETIVQFSRGWLRFRCGSSEFTASWCAKLSQAWKLLYLFSLSVKHVQSVGGTSQPCWRHCWCCLLLWTTFPSFVTFFHMI